MPYKVVRSSACPANKPWAVINKNTGKVHGCHANEDKATAQMRLLYGIEGGSIKK